VVVGVEGENGSVGGETFKLLRRKSEEKDLNEWNLRKL
jgi:hypothetical protein